MKCCICDGEIEKREDGWNMGNNAEPVSEGRCCDVCNYTVVIPARMEWLGISRNEKSPSRTY